MNAPASTSQGLTPWSKADLPDPPMPRGLGWIGVCGPGVIVLGVSIGSGEFLLGPAMFVKHGLTLLWVTLVASFFQALFNTELVRYTLYTGEPAVTGFMRTRPRSTFWAWFYAGLYLLQNGWPAWAGASAGAFFFLAVGRAARPDESGAVYFTALAVFGGCVLLLLFRSVGGPQTTDWEDPDEPFSWTPAHRPVLPPDLAPLMTSPWPRPERY